MFKFSILAIALTTVAAPVLAASPVETTRFERDGRVYEATVVTDGAMQRIDGMEVDTGRSFHLRVMNGRVTGDYAGTKVSYRTPAKSAVQTASN